MNKKQLIILWIGIALIVGMGIYPPYMESFEDTGGFVPQGYNFIFSERSEWRRHEMVNVPQLFAQWFIVAVITGGLLVTFKDKKKDKEK